MLDRFDKCIRFHFGPALNELLKKEQEMKEKEGADKKFDLETRYKIVMGEVSVADAVKSLVEPGRSGGQ